MPPSRRRHRQQNSREDIMNARASLSFGMVALSLAAVPLAPAQDRIDKPVKIVVGFAAGATADVMARVVADKLKDSVGQPVIVDNRPGAIGRIAAEAVKNAPPDGATIMVMPIGPMAVVPHVYSDIPYDPVKDFTAVALGSTFQFAIAAGPASGAKTWSEFAAWVKANPGKAAYATSSAARCRQPSTRSPI
jgi:tripartite-type tricarboxylate transporter receptor subunit TctC